ncbi:TetR-like C-terminal domain-containing protein [Nonomuraea sp. NPDC049152]|uniref:TetR-like C-terminal domain-containing protein n=1 Tax=Nonomuraea sp. NPDC049152 TaxID=3154350 RepID=UPI0033C12512
MIVVHLSDRTVQPSSDLRALLNDQAEICEGPGGLLLIALIGEALHNDALADALTTAFIVPVQARMEALVRRAVDRGEILQVENLRLISDLVIGPMFSRAFLARGALDPGALTEMADQLILFLLHALNARAG